METRWVWPFELLDKLGEGGMGVVYRARYVGNDRQVAVKLLPPGADANPTLLARFEREMEVLKQLRHPNIVHCFGGTCESKQRFYAMELVEGGSLSDVMKGQGKVSWEKAVDYAIQMCDALQFAHDHGVIHRDVKPGNFLITKQGQLKLSDFGLVTVVAGHRLTASGRTLGTADYMSPEQIRGKPPLTNRSDLYSLGCVLHEMLTGEPPFTGDSSIEVMHKHLNEPIPHVARTILECPFELDQAICELLAKRPEQRPESAEAVKQMLEDILMPGRRFRSVEQSLFPSRANVNTKVNVKNTNIALPQKIRSSEDSQIVPVPRVTVPVPSMWLWAVVMIVVSLSLVGWSKANSRLRAAENALVEQLKTGDKDTRIFAAKTLEHFSTLPAAAVNELFTLANTAHDDVRVAALETLAKHPNQSRDLQWEIYKLQKNTEVGSAVRQQAEQTFNVLKRAPGTSLTVMIITWLTIVAVVCGFAFGGWWVWQQLQAMMPPGRSPARHA